MSLENDIRKMETAGIQVTATDKEGKITYRTDLNKKENVCDSCEFLRLKQDPDPDDWFDDDDMMAFCNKANRTIASALRPGETINISKPLWCPYLGRELTDEEKKILEILNKNID